MRAFRGATTVERDEPGLIRHAVREMMNEMVRVNDLDSDDLVDCILTVTADLTSMYAGTALRQECGFDDVPLLGAVEANVATGPERCIRVLLHAYSPLARADVKSVYHGDARRLRPDLTDS